ncbi:hypothetical protein JTB14_016131 [Gonioctena quinquepunctata]|nr:hypothetical protein JTB14_016131 [Gonioctena quinquepunctata]
MSCPRRFGSARGGSVHQRSAHPEVRNEARLETVEPKIPEAAGIKRYPGQEWTEQEENLLQLLEILYRGVCNPEIHPHRESYEIPDLTTPESDINSTFKTNEPAPTGITGYGDEEVAWRQAMAASAVRTHHKLKDSLKGRAYQDMERRLEKIASTIMKRTPQSTSECRENL